MPLARWQWAASGESHQLVFVDDNPLIDECNGHQVLTYSEWIKQPADSRYVNIAIADSALRQKLAERCMSDNINFFEIRAPNVVELDDVELGEGAILCSFVTLTTNIRIGKHFHANLYSYVEHNCTIGDYVTFAPGVRCNGNVVLEDHVYIGSGAIIKQGHPASPLVIGRGAVVGMGAVVTKSVPSGVTVVGNPARSFT
jgi:sugar O-acyltransferase (sialic acid O-acetyltransferase NeuD family)